MTRIHRSKCILAALLSAAMVVWNVFAATSVYAAPAIEDFREDAELINDLVLPAAVQKKSRNRNASPSEATAAKERQALFAGAAGWGTPSSATKILRTELDGVAIDASAPAGVLPEGAVLKARRLTDEEEREVLKRISEHADTEGKAVTTQFLCDLTVFNAAGKAVQPDSSKGQLVVSFRNVGIVAADLTEMGDDKAHSTDATVSVLHIDEAEHKVDTLREGLPASLPALQVAAEHFSPFAVVNYRPATTPTLGVEFKMLDYDNDSRLDYRLKDVTVLDTAGNGISSMSIQVDSGYIDSVPDYVPGADSHDYKLFTDINANHLFYQIIFPTPLTPAEAKTFLENKLHFHLASQGANQQLTISLGNGPSRFPENATIKLTKATIPNPMPGDSAEHYYMYVEPQPKRLISWAESYNLAKQTYLDGMQGYLVTVTSAAEDNILNQVTATNIGAWSGGARFEGINDSDSVPNWTDNLAPGRTAGSVFANQSLSGSTGSGAHRRFRWQNGPETGIEYYEQGNGGSTPTGNGHALNTPYGIYSHFEPTGGMTYEPNSSGGMHGGPYVSGYESVMQVHNAGHWNDLHNVSEYTGGGLDVKGFYIEFSGYKRTGSTSEQVVPLHTASTVYAEQNGQRYYFQTADEAVIWVGQNGNAPLTLIGDTTLTGDIPANVSLDLNGHTLTVPASSSVVNHGSIDASNPASRLHIQGSYGGFRNVGSGRVTRQLTVRMNALTYHLNDATPAGHPASNPNSGFTGYTVETPNYALADPVRAGYPFEGWFTDAALSVPAPTVIDTTQGDTNPTDYYAKWGAALPYAIDYRFNDDTPAGHAARNSVSNPSGFRVTDPDISLHAPVRTGYVFEGWYRDAGFTIPIRTIYPASAENYTVYAKWSNPIHYAVQWDLNDGTLSGPPAVNPNGGMAGYTVEDADFVMQPTSRPGYTFEGWYDNAALLGTPVTTLRTMEAENKHYYAKWSAPLQYPVRYELNDSAANPAIVPASNLLRYSIETNGGGAIQLSPAFRQGFDFLGWYDNAAFAGGPVTDFPATDATPKTYYAKWQIKSYRLQYHLNGGSGSHMPINPAVNPDRYTIEGAVPLVPPQRQGYTGIWVENGQTVTNIPAGSTGDRTLTAVWTLNRYPLHYELGETVNSRVEGLPALPQSYTAEDADITLPTPHRIGYTFLRWEKSGAPGVADNRIQAGSAGELTFRAIWEPIRYRIHYDTAGGTNNTQNPTTFTIEDEVSPYGSVKQGMRFWTWQLVGGKFIHTIPAGTTHDIALVARYQKDRDSDNIGGGNSSGSNNSGSGERQRQPLPDGVVNKKDQERKTVNAGSEDGERIEPVPQKRADARAEVLHESVSPEHGERNAKLVAATESFEQHRHARLPKTGEMPFRIPMAFLLFVSLLASNLSYVLYAIRGFGKKKAEWF